MNTNDLYSQITAKVEIIFSAFYKIMGNNGKHIYYYVQVVYKQSSEGGYGEKI